MVHPDREHEELASLVSSAVLLVGIGLTLLLAIYIAVEWYLKSLPQ